MIIGNLNFEKVMTRKDLVSKTCYDFIVDNYTEDEIENIYVSEIDTNYIDGISLCEHYNVAKENGVNCLIVECKRGQTKSYAALLVPVGYKYNMSSTVRKHTNSRMVSVAPLEYVLDATKMEHGSINPIGLPKEWKIFVDPKVLDVKRIICGSGKRTSKLSLPSKYLLKLPNVEVLNDLTKEEL